MPINAFQHLNRKPCLHKLYDDVENNNSLVNFSGDFPWSQNSCGVLVCLARVVGCHVWSCAQGSARAWPPSTSRRRSARATACGWHTTSTPPRWRSWRGGWACAAWAGCSPTCCRASAPPPPWSACAAWTRTSCPRRSASWRATSRTCTPARAATPPPGTSALSSSPFASRVICLLRLTFL